MPIVGKQTKMSTWSVILLYIYISGKYRVTMVAWE